MKGSTKMVRYAKISLKKRMKLVQLVTERKKTVAAASRVLGIKTSTAKLIVKRYRQEGTYFQRKDVKNARIEKENQQNSFEQIFQSRNSQVLQEVPQNQTYFFPQQPIFCINPANLFQSVPLYPPNFFEAPFQLLFPQIRMP